MSNNKEITENKKIVSQDDNRIWRDTFEYKGSKCNLLHNEDSYGANSLVYTFKYNDVGYVLKEFYPKIFSNFLTRENNGVDGNVCINRLKYGQKEKITTEELENKKRDLLIICEKKFIISAKYNENYFSKNPVYILESDLITLNGDSIDADNINLETIEKGIFYLFRDRNGVSLRELIDKPLKEKLKIVKDILDELAIFHDMGKLHLDIKPGNIFLIKFQNGEIQPRLIDFDAVEDLTVLFESIKTGYKFSNSTKRYYGNELGIGADDAMLKEICKNPYSVDLYAIANTLWYILFQDEFNQNKDIKTNRKEAAIFEMLHRQLFNYSSQLTDCNLCDLLTQFFVRAFSPIDSSFGENDKIPYRKYPLDLKLSYEMEINQRSKRFLTCSEMKEALEDIIDVIEMREVNETTLRQAGFIKADNLIQ